MKYSKFFSKFALISGLLVAGCEDEPEPVSPPDVPIPTPEVPAQTDSGTASDYEKKVGDSKTVYFAFDKQNITPESKEKIAKQIEWLKQYPSVSMVVEGHCDPRGTEEYNIALGERRASSVRKELVDSGISGDRITTMSYGKSRPAADGSGEESWSKNRRAVTVVK
jgi:peptidoglycan-associated lipoprotein